MQCLVLAGGRGMRLDSLTSHWPAPLLYMPGGTLLDYLFHHISLLPVEPPRILLQYKGDAIASYLSERYDDRFEQIPQLPPFTTFGALASAVPHVEGPTLVLHANHYYSHSLADVLTEIDLERPTFFTSRENDTLDAVGAYVLTPDAFYLAAQSLANGSPAALFRRLEEGGLAPQRHMVDGHAFPVHTITDVLNLNRFLLIHWHEVLWPPVAGVGYEALTYSWIAPSAHLVGTNNVRFSTVGPRVTLKNSVLTNSLVYPYVELNNQREHCTVMVVDGRERVMQLYGNPARLDAPDCK